MNIFRRTPAVEYFDLFEAAAANASRAAQLLARMIERFPDDGDAAREILLCEQEGDRITQRIIRLLGESARPPLPPGATHRLAGAVDDVVDHIEQAADCFMLYRVEAPMDPSPALAAVLVAATEQLQAAIATLRSGSSMADAIFAVHQLESDGDRLTREAIAALFAGGVDPMVVIRWKDIFGEMEHAIDACEDVAHVLEGGPAEV